MQNGYTILDIKKMQLSDIELMVEALEKDKKTEKEEVEEGTLDQAFPFLLVLLKIIKEQFLLFPMTNILSVKLE